MLQGDLKLQKAEAQLWWWNVVCGFAHLIQACVVLGLGSSRDTFLGKFTLPLSTQYLLWPEEGPPKSTVEIRYLLPFVSFVSGFAWITAASRVVVLLNFKKYLAGLRVGINRFRWYEYSVTSSWMIVSIFLLFGCYDILSLVLVAALNAVTNLLGYLMESTNIYTREMNKGTDWTPFWFASFAGLVPWCVLFAYVAGTSDGIPGFVWAILFTFLISYSTFPMNMAGQYAKWKYWIDEYQTYPGGGYLFGERAYQVQALVSQTVLLWLVVAGVNQENQFS